MGSFDVVAEKFDQLWFFSASYQNWMLKNVCQLLSLEKTDRFADLGGGTGAFTAKVAAAAELDHPAACVEPSREMLSMANCIGGLHTYHSTAEEFASKRPRGINKALIKEAVHHIKDRKAFWSNLFADADMDKTVVVTRPKRPGFVLFEQAYEAFSESQPHLSELQGEIESVGLNAQVDMQSWKVELPKEEWFGLLRMRFNSALFTCSDRDIEEGILQIDDALDGSTILFEDTIIYLSASR